MCDAYARPIAGGPRDGPRDRGRLENGTNPEEREERKRGERAMQVGQKEKRERG